MEKVGQNLFHAVGRFQGERGHGKVHRHFGQAVPHIKRYRVKHGAHSGAAGGGAPHRKIPPFAVPQFALVEYKDGCISDAGNGEDKTIWKYRTFELYQ